MGYYLLPGRPVTGKAGWLRANCKAVTVIQPERFSVPAGKALICVVDTGWHEAAAYVYSEAEFRDWTQPGDRRSKTWLLMDRDMAEKMSGYR